MMMRVTQMACVLALAALLTGCRTAYMQDRKHDAADIVTVTVGSGAGVTARVGPVHAGLYSGDDRYGLRCGEFMWPKREGVQSCTTDPLILLPNFGGGPTLFWFDAFEGEAGSRLRGKEYSAEGICPFISLPRLDSLDRGIGRRYAAYYLTQCEVAAGLWRTARLGVNPGELLDFLLGWTTLDIFGDDIGVREQKN
jgi:hypothetical protein